MKKLLYIISIAVAAAVSCSRDPMSGQEWYDEGEGALRLSIALSDVTRVNVDEEPYSHCDIRIFKYNDAGQRELVRHYFDIEDLQEELWLAVGSYNAEVRLGDENRKPGKKPFLYLGSEDFEIRDGYKTPVEVVCRIQNTVIEVNFDQTVNKVFDISRQVIVQMLEEFDSERFDDADVALRFDESGRGYFVIPDGCSKISFCFLGRSSDTDIVDGSDNEGHSPAGEIHEHYNGLALDTERLKGYCYRINLKYSSDMTGFISWSVAIAGTENPDPDHAELNPSTRPSIKGHDFDMDDIYKASESVSYDIAGDKKIVKVELSCDGGEPLTIDCGSDGEKEHGVSVASYAAADQRGITLTLGSGFINTLRGGVHSLNIKAYINSTVYGEADVKLMTQGVFSLIPTDKWYAKGEIRACVFEDGEVKVRYRNAEGEWKVVDAEPSGENEYMIQAEEIHANTAYEMQLQVNGRETGPVVKESTGDGEQIYNSDLEIWNKIGYPWCPYTSLNVDQWWDSGNHGSTTLGSNYNITTPSDDIRPDSKGSKSALLTSRNIANNLAAGNLFLGKFLGTKNLTKGVVRFGQSFDFTYRPKALRFWYKSEIGTVDLGSGAPGLTKGDQDVQQIYILLCAMDGPHLVDTGDQSSFLNVTDGIKEITYCTTPIPQISTSSKNNATAHVIGWGVWEPSESHKQWTLKEITINYNEEYEDEVPEWLMITACANKYGDYYMGCSKNTMSLDDFELVY